MAFRIEHRIGIQAPAATIWALLADVDGWPAWNPLYPEASGRIGLGERLQLTQALPGGAPQRFEARVADWEPNAQIVWRQDRMPWVAHSVRYLEIEVLSETGCIFANGEFFHGLLGERIGKANRKTIRDGFESLGEAVKVRAEAAWRAEAPAPTSAA